MLTGCAGTTSPSDLFATQTSRVTPTRRSTWIPTASPTPQPTATYSPHSIGPDNFPNIVNPLTGLTVANASLLNRRPVSVKITLYPRSARPQWGLSLADIVYEYYHNNDLTRFNAIFYSQDAAMVGPIRSARLFDNYLTFMYKSDFVFGSADSRILDFLNNQDYSDRLLYRLDGSCPPTPVCRFNPGGANYLITDTSAVRTFLKSVGVQDRRQNLNGMTFSPLTPAGGQSINRIYVRYSVSAYLYWQYDASTGRYFRFQDNQENIGGLGEGYHQLIDRLNDQPIQADNVVVLTMSHCHVVYVPPEGDIPAIEIVNMDFVGSGIAYAFRDGQAYEVHWVRPTNDWVVYLINSDGSPYFFKPGTTWFQVITDKSS
ncbi:MAG: DUF3048 domain-containing protein, partial [Chloroflexi bacterium]|nr:DUF3048 domain-containing protein [Chloroflexota bacterium]